MPKVTKKLTLEVDGVAEVTFCGSRITIVGGVGEWKWNQNTLFIDTPPGVYSNGNTCYSSGDRIVCSGRYYSKGYQRKQDVKPVETVHLDVPDGVVFDRVTLAGATSVTFTDAKHLLNYIDLQVSGTSGVHFVSLKNSTFSKITALVSGCSSINGNGVKCDLLQCGVSGTSSLNGFHINTASRGIVSGVSNLNCTSSRSSDNNVSKDFCSNVNISRV
jgi:hypothetical protein